MQYRRWDMKMEAMVHNDALFGADPSMELGAVAFTYDRARQRPILRLRLPGRRK
jgi:hypothetical protein